jgi:cytochrome P450
MSGPPSLPPGPKLPPIVQTGFWVLRPTEFMERCAKRFGDFFTVRLFNLWDIVFVSDPKAVKEIFTASPDLLHAGESNVFLEPVVGDRSVLLLDGSDHLRQRKLMLPPFHGERMQGYGALIEEITERDMRSWPTGERFALRPRTRAITLEVIMQAVFGIQDGERRRRLSDLLTTMTDESGSRLRWIGLMLPALRRSFGLGRRSPWVRFVESRSRVDAMIYEEIALRRSDPDLGERQDILSLLLQARHEDGSPMSDKELRDELMTLLVAGHETTATALAWAFELLLANPRTLERLEDEVLSGGEAYLDAVIKETLRLRPVLPLVGRMLKAPMTLNGYRLQAGTMLAPCIYLTQRRADVYPEPERFRPERFLDEQPDTYAWLPFGGGIRRCIGASFAMFEMKVVIPAVIRRMRLRAVGRKPEPIRRRAITFVPGRDATVVAERRSIPERAPDRVAAAADHDVAAGSIA